MTAPAPVPADPNANKALTAAVGTIVTVLLRWAVSGQFTFSDEGLVALAGAITTLAVYVVSNYRSLLGLRRPVRVDDGYGAVELVIVVLVILILVFVLLRVA